jgi:hypothetical protein
MIDKPQFIRMAEDTEAAMFEKQHNAIMKDIHAVLKKHIGAEERLYFMLMLPAPNSTAVATDLTPEAVTYLVSMLQATSATSFKAPTSEH